MWEISKIDIRVFMKNLYQCSIELLFKLGGIF